MDMFLIILATSALQHLQNGDLLPAVLQPLTSILGDWAYALFFGSTFMGIFLKTQSAAIPIVTFILLAPFIVVFLPAGALPFFSVFASLGIGSIVYSAYTHRM